MILPPSSGTLIKSWQCGLIKSNSTTVPFKVVVCDVSYAAAPWCANMGPADKRLTAAAHKITVSLRIMLYLPHVFKFRQPLTESLCRDKLLNPCACRNFTGIDVSL